MHLPESPQQPVPYHLQCLADLEQVSPCFRKHQICFIKMGMKIPSKKGNYFNTATVSFTWSTQKEGVLYTDPCYTFQTVSHTPFKIHHISQPQKTVLSPLRNIKPLAGSIRILHCLIEALKNMEGVTRCLMHSSQLYTFIRAAITTLSSQEEPWQTFTSPVKAFKTILHM